MSRLRSRIRYQMEFQEKISAGIVSKGSHLVPHFALLFCFNLVVWAHVWAHQCRSVHDDDSTTRGLSPFAAATCAVRQHAGGGDRWRRVHGGCSGCGFQVPPSLFLSLCTLNRYETDHCSRKIWYHHREFLHNIIVKFVGFISCTRVESRKKEYDEVGGLKDGESMLPTRHNVVLPTRLSVPC